MENYITTYEEWIDIGTYRREDIINLLLNLIVLLREGEPTDNYVKFINLLKTAKLFKFIGMDIYMIKKHLYDIYYRYMTYQCLYVAYIPLVMHTVVNKREEDELEGYFLNETTFTLENFLLKYNIIQIKYSTCEKEKNMNNMFKAIYHENEENNFMGVSIELECREYIKDLNNLFPNFSRRAMKCTNNYNIEQELMVDVTHIILFRKQYKEVMNYLIEENL